jgi:DNA ligase-4
LFLFRSNRIIQSVKFKLDDLIDLFVSLGLNDEIDCLIVGGYFGTGRLRAGMLSHFLCCAVVKQANTSEQKNLDDENAATSTQCKADVRDFLYYTFCKIGSGYTHKELLDFNNRFANKWKPWTKKTAPSYILCTHEKPDVWIEPSDSCIVQVKATEFMASDKYKCGFTLRFPRLEKFREDKAWHECVTYQELIDLRERNAGKLASRFMEHELNDDFDLNQDGQRTLTLTKKLQTKSRQQAKPTVDSRFRGIDQQSVKQTGHFFSNLEFCIMEGNTKYTKAELEKLIYENGGTCVQNALAKTHAVITGKNKTQEYIIVKLYRGAISRTRQVRPGLNF